MKNKFTMVLFLLGSFNYFTAQAQQKIIAGKVTSFEESFPLEAVAIQVEESRSTSGTQADGTFSICVSNDDKTLVFQLDGYETVEVPIAARKAYDVVLRLKSSQLGKSD